MDQVARNNFDNVAPTPLPARRVFHNLAGLAKQSNVLPKLVPLYPPEPSTSYSRGQKKPTNIFEKLVPKLESGYRGSRRHGDSGIKDRSQQKTGSWDVEWSVTPSSVIPSDAPTFSQTDLDTSALPTSTLEQTLSVESGPSSPIYSPQSALIDALGLAFNPVLPTEPLSHSQPRVVSQNEEEQGQGIKFSSSNVNPTQSHSRILRRKWRYPYPMVFSTSQFSQASPAPSKKVPCGTPGHSIRKPSSSSRRTSRSVMVGHNSIELTASTNPYNTKPTYTYRRQSISSSLSSIIQAAGIDQPLTSIHGQNSPSTQALKRESREPPPATLILPPVQIHPLTCSPFLAEFNDLPSSIGGSAAPSTPSINTPPVSLSSILSQMDIRVQKNLRHHGRYPSSFLNLGPTSPIPSPIEQAQTNIAQAPTASKPPPRFDSLRGCSRATLERAIEATEKKKAGETKSVPSKASLRPKLTLQIPKTGDPSHSTVTHWPVAPIRPSTDDIKIGTRRIRPLPSIPITRQQSM